MKDVAMVKKFFANLPGANSDAVELAWAKRGLINVSRMDTNALMEVQKIFDENGIEYISKQSGIPIFSLFVFRPNQLTPDRIECLKLAYGQEKNQMMNR